MARTSEPFTADEAAEAGARLVVELVTGLVKTPEGLADVRVSLIAGLPHVRDKAEAEIMRRVVEKMRGAG